MKKCRNNIVLQGRNLNNRRRNVAKPAGICLILFLSYLSFSLFAQTDTERPYSINEGTLIGIGGSHIKNTYLSPINYSGTGMRIVNERMKIIAVSDKKISSWQLLDIDLS